MNRFHLYFILIILGLLIYNCSKPTEPLIHETPDQKIIVSGTVNQVTQTDTLPGDSCTVWSMASNDTTSSITNSNGYFIDTLHSADKSIRLLINKKGFSPIDTIIRDNSLDLKFTLKFNQITISGIVYEINENGTFPYKNGQVKIYSGGIENTVRTNDSGNFELVTNDFDKDIRILIDNESYTTVDTTVSIENSNFLQLYIAKYISYFPLKVGSIWQFDAHFARAGDYMWPEYSGTEQWELTELASDSSWFRIKTIFNGLEILMHWGYPEDTTIISNAEAVLTINKVGDSLALASRTGSDISGLGIFFDVTEFYPVYQPKIIYPANLEDSIYVKENYYIYKYIEYEIVKNVGFILLKSHWDEGLNSSYFEKLDLIDYQIP